MFANVVLADEINRATPKTQSALLEVMDRARVTVDGEAHAVGSPFMVFATQNPRGLRGHVSAAGKPDGPLPDAAAQGYPEANDEREILRSARGGYDAIGAQSPS